MAGLPDEFMDMHEDWETIFDETMPWGFEIDEHQIPLLHQCTSAPVHQCTSASRSAAGSRSGPASPPFPTRSSSDRAAVAGIW